MKLTWTHQHRRGRAGACMSRAANENPLRLFSSSQTLNCRRSSNPGQNPVKQTPHSHACTSRAVTVMSRWASAWSQSKARPPIYTLALFFGPFWLVDEPWDEFKKAVRGVVHHLGWWWWLTEPKATTAAWEHGGSMWWSAVSAVCRDWTKPVEGWCQRKVES